MEIYNYGCSVGIRTTPLHIAVHKNNIMETSRLIETGSDINAKDENGNTPIHVALYMTHVDIDNHEILRLLINCDMSDVYPLHRCCQLRRVACVEYLLYVGFDINQKDKGDMTPLDWTLCYTYRLKENIDFIDYLIKCGAEKGEKSYKYAMKENIVMGGFIPTILI